MEVVVLVVEILPITITIMVFIIMMQRWVELLEVQVVELLEELVHVD
jgi:hypothetical protein